VASKKQAKSTRASGAHGLGRLVSKVKTFIDEYRSHDGGER
jgi:hypothetical protein